MVNYLTAPELETLASYNKIGIKWSVEHMNQDHLWKFGFTGIEELVPEGGSILEVGCGGGRDAVDLLKRYNYTGTDVSEVLVQAAQKNNPGGKFLQQSVYELDFISNTFDCFWTVATLLHIPKERIDEALNNIHRVTKAGGVGFISIKQGQGENVVEEEDCGEKIRRFFAFYSLEEFIEILNRNNFEVVKHSTLPFSRTTWLMFLVRVKK